MEYVIGIVVACFMEGNCSYQVSNQPFESIEHCTESMGNYIEYMQNNRVIYDIEGACISVNIGQQAQE